MLFKQYCIVREYNIHYYCIFCKHFNNIKKQFILLALYLIKKKKYNSKYLNIIYLSNKRLKLGYCIPQINRQKLNIIRITYTYRMNNRLRKLYGCIRFTSSAKPFWTRSKLFTRISNTSVQRFTTIWKRTKPLKLLLSNARRTVKKKKKNDKNP